MEARTGCLPPGAALTEISEGEDFTVHRIFLTADPDDPAFLDSLRSNAELGDEPRGFEVTYPLLHIGISTYRTRAAAEEKARQFPKLGRYAAAIQLPGGVGLTFAAWGRRGHLTVWGDVDVLAAAITAVEPVSL